MNPIWTHYTTNLTCIEVDNATYSTTNWTYIDPASSFSTNCNNNCINPCPIPITSTDTRSECDSLNWINGTTYTSSNNTATFNIAGGADNGCDSIVTLNLTINSTTGTDTRTACDSFTWIDGNTYTSANNTATYNIVNGNSNGCDSLVSLNLTISNLDADFTFTDNGNGNYSFTNTSIGNFNQSHWAFGDGTIDSIANPNHTFTTNGIFTVVLTINDSTLQEDSCISYYIDTINVTGVSNPLPCHSGFAIYPDSTTGDINIVNSSTGFNLTYLWDFGDGNTSTLQNPSHPYATSGPHYLCLTVDDGAGCVDMYCDSIGENGVVFKTGGFTINIIGTPIITELDNHTELNSNINIYPNPTSNQLTINTELKLSEITIIDITGKTMITTKQNTNIINVADLSDGIYFIKLVVEERTITKKFVKQ
jgi:PKD repeat protein